MQELTDEEQRVRREGLRILARLIARHHLAVTAAATAPGDQEVAETEQQQQTGTRA